MFKRLSILPLIAVLISLLIPNLAQAGVRASSATLSASATSITAGESVTFTVAVTCTETPWSAEVQLIDDSNGNPLSDPQTVTSSNVTATITVPFSQAGTFRVGLDITGDQNSVNCDFGITSGNTVFSFIDVPQTITVAAAATTTVAPTTTTTTIAPTTTKKPREVLPATGSDNTGLFVAAGVALAGGAILISRRRLLSN